MAQGCVFVTQDGSEASFTSQKSHLLVLLKFIKVSLLIIHIDRKEIMEKQQRKSVDYRLLLTDRVRYKPSLIAYCSSSRIYDSVFRYIWDTTFRSRSLAQLGNNWYSVSTFMRFSCIKIL
jgi:hypothetical protein